MADYDEFLDQLDQVWKQCFEALAPDPFLGTGTTTVAAARWGRNSIGYEIEKHYFEHAQQRIHQATANLFSKAHVTFGKE